MTPRPLAWGEGVSEYIQRHSLIHHRPGSRILTKRTLKRFGAFIGKRPLSEISRRDIEAFYVSLLATLKTSTANSHLIRIRGFFQWLVWAELLEKNPALLVKKKKVVKARKPLPSSSDIAAFTAHLRAKGDTYYSDLVTTVANTGLRIDEALHIRPVDVETNPPRIHVAAWGDFIPKDFEERRIPLNTKVLQILRRRILTASGGPLFARKGRIPSVSTVSHMLKYKATKAGYARISWQSLRRFFGTMMAEHANEQALLILMGHSSPSTTKQYYIDAAEVRLPTPPCIG